jgi:hypothetical protein
MDVEVLSDNLRDVWLGSFKLLVNRSRFSRSEKKPVESQNDHPQGAVPLGGGSGPQGGATG